MFTDLVNNKTTKNATNLKKSKNLVSSIVLFFDMTNDDEILLIYKTNLQIQEN